MFRQQTTSGQQDNVSYGANLEPDVCSLRKSQSVPPAKRSLRRQSGRIRDRAVLFAVYWMRAFSFQTLKTDGDDDMLTILPKMWYQLGSWRECDPEHRRWSPVDSLRLSERIWKSNVILLQSPYERLFVRQTRLFFYILVYLNMIVMNKRSLRSYSCTVGHYIMSHCTAKR